jgi:hypothetical protein
MTISSNKISFPGINKNNFWNEITLKQRGNYPWTEDEMKIYFKVTDKVSNKFLTITLGLRNNLKQWPTSSTNTSSNIQAQQVNVHDLGQQERQHLYDREEAKLLKQEELAYIAISDYTKTII